MAGESAYESARRQREKAARLLRSAELHEMGAEGERVTAEVLEALPRDEWTILHDVRWPGRRFANVDHVVIGPPGVFVVDSKNWSGRIEVRDQVLRQNGYQREQTVAGAADAALAMARLVPLLRIDLVVPVLCFVRDEPLADWTRDVMVCSTGNLLAMITSRPPVLQAWQVRDVALQLDAQLRASPPSASRPTPRTRTMRPGSSPARLLKLIALFAGLYVAYAFALMIVSTPAR